MNSTVLYPSLAEAFGPVPSNASSGCDGICCRACVLEEGLRQCTIYCGDALRVAQQRTFLAFFLLLPVVWVFPAMVACCCRIRSVKAPLTHAAHDSSTTSMSTTARTLRASCCRARWQ